MISKYILPVMLAGTIGYVAHQPTQKVVVHDVPHDIVVGALPLIYKVPVYVPVVLNNFEKEQIRCMAVNAYFEARNQPVAGVIAITDVVLNRVNNSKFPSTPCKVVYERHGHVCQFSWVCQRHGPIKDWQLYGKIKYIVENVYVKRNIRDLSDGALYYHTAAVKPKFFKKVVKTVKIGNHIFFKVASN